MADESTFGGGLALSGPGGGLGDTPDAAAFGGGEPAGGSDGTDVLPAAAQPTEGQGLFGSGLNMGPPQYRQPSQQHLVVDPQDAALNQSADLLQQRIDRAGKVATNPFVQLFNPEGAAAARQFVPQATEQLLKIQQQKATIQANRQQADTLGLLPGEGGLTDQSTQEQRVAVAQQRALKGDLGVFRGLMTVDPKAAEAIQDRVYETVAGHLDKAQYAYGTLSNMTTPQEYDAAVRMLRQNGTLGELEGLGLKVPSYDQFQAQKAGMGRTLREAQIGANAIRTKLEERNTYMPMEKKEAETYTGRLTTAYGDKVENGVWSRNSAAGTRGFVVNGMDDPRNLGKTYTLATEEQRKAIREEFSQAVPKEQLEKYRENERTYKLATTDKDGNKLPEGELNTNPNIQQGIAEGLAAALRGGSGGANVGLLKIETGKRGVVQGVIDEIMAAKAGALNTLSAKEVQPYLTKLTRGQVRYVLDFLHAYNTQHIGDVGQRIAERAGALGLGPEVVGLTKSEAGGLADAFETGRNAQVERMMPYHQAIGGGDGVIQLGAQRPGAGAAGIPGGTQPTQQLPGAPALRTPVQQAMQPAPAPGPQGPGTPPAEPKAPAATQPPAAPAGGGAPTAPQQFSGPIAGQNVSVALPPGASPDYVARMQKIESGNEKSPWTAGAGGLSSASGAFQFIKGTWEQYKPAGAPARAADATPQQQAEALANLTRDNAASLQRNGIPVNDTNLYIAHNLGAGGAKALLTADPKADARDVVGEAAARNNPLFFRGKPTVAQALERYATKMGDVEGAARANPDSALNKPSFWDMLSGRKAGEMGKVEGDFTPEHVATPAERAKSPVVENAPAIASTLGGIGGGIAGGPVGGVAGGATGGAAGQAFKDWMQGRSQDPVAIGKEAALGGVLGVTSAARPVVAGAARIVGAGAVEGGAAALEGKDAGEVAEAGGTGMLSAAGGEAFGRALGMIGHKIWSNLRPDVQTQLQTAASDLAAARKAMETEPPKLATGSTNPAYEAAEKAATKAEKQLKDAGLNPDEAAYAAEQTAAKTPRAEALANRPGAIEQAEVSRGYDQLRADVDKAGVGAPKPAPKLPDGPLAAVENGLVAKSASNTRRAQEAEVLVTAPAKSWGEKWDQLVEARSKLLASERTALSSTSADKDLISGDRRKLADTVRAQQKKVADYVFGPGKGEAAIKRLEVLDARYARLQEATGGGDVLNVAKLSGQKGRDADKAFRAFAHDDPQAIAAWDHLRRTAGTHSGEGWLHAAIHLPFVGKAISAARMAVLLHRWNAVRAAGGNVKFRDLVRNMPDDSGVERALGQAGARAATM